MLAGAGDDKTDIVLYAEVYKRDAIYSRDRDISSNTDFTRLGGGDDRSGDFAGTPRCCRMAKCSLEILFTSHSLIAVDVLLRRTPFQM